MARGSTVLRGLILITLEMTTHTSGSPTEVGAGRARSIDEEASSTSCVRRALSDRWKIWRSWRQYKHIFSRITFSRILRRDPDAKESAYDHSRKSA